MRRSRAISAFSFLLSAALLLVPGLGRADDALKMYGGEGWHGPSRDRRRASARSFAERGRRGLELCRGQGRSASRGAAADAPFPFQITSGGKVVNGTLNIAAKDGRRRRDVEFHGEGRGGV